MKLALGIPGVGDVPAAFAHDLARLTAHIVTTHFDVELRVLASVEPPSNEQREEILGAAREWGADLILFPNPDTRIPANAIDDLLASVRNEQIVLPKSKIEVVTH